LARREHDYEVGDTIRGEGGDYLVLKLYGAGGMGAVYLVKDKNIGRRFVLKIMHRRLSHREDLKERHHHEARALGNLSPHEGIIEVFNLSWTRDRERMPYYLMEALSGETLAEAIQRAGTIEMASALGMTVKILNALDHAHARGVIHRDVKPENIFLYGETGLKLLDFGILKLTDAAEDRGMFLGTPRYAAPEQLRGDAVGASADLYAVGVVIYRLLTGVHPFESFGGSLKDMVETLIIDAPSLATRGDFPSELVALVDSALAKDPERRPRDAFTFAAKLHAIHERVVPKGAKDPHTHVTVEARIEPPREPSQITMAKLADPTNPDPDHARLMQALAAGEGDHDEVSGPASEQPKLTGYESTAEKPVAERLLPVATQPSPVAAVPAVPRGAGARAEVVSEGSIESGVDRAAMTAAPATPGAAGAGPGSIQYLSQERPRPDGARPAAKIQYTAPLVARKAVQQHFTVPMPGRPSREAATPEPQELAARPTSRPPRASSRSILGRLQRLVELRALPLAVAVAGGIVALALLVGGRRGTGDTTSSPATGTQSVAVAPPPLAASAALNVSGSSPVAQAPAGPSIVPASALEDDAGAARTSTTAAAPASAAPKMAVTATARAVPARAPASSSKSRPVLSPSDVKFE
jgi:serine/threonine-protein kinase